MFMVKDKTHPEKKEIHEILEVLKMQMEKLWYRCCEQSVP